MLNENTFLRRIAIERKRTERSREPFLLMLLDASHPRNPSVNQIELERMAVAMLQSSRETDVVGWYKKETAIGVIFTGLQFSDKDSLLSTILNRVQTIFRDQRVFSQFTQVGLSFHLFPDDWDHDGDGHPSNPNLYPDLMIPGRRRRNLLLVKRVIDVTGSALALLAFSPLFLAIALAVKLTSKGPVFFRQQRVGQYGKCFTMLKFRSMYVNSDARIHKNFTKELINNRVERNTDDGCAQQECAYKLKNDRRITRIGKLLRRTSMDELPQFLNVLQGEMSLVGPRPPILYEMESYQTWHRRRILEAKPGITGLWQVAGRSRVRFDEMVRMDLRYAMSWSPWLDLKILILTPMAVIRGAGAQ